MANKRMVHGSVWEDEWFSTLIFFDRLLWIGLITGAADDQGRILDNATLIRSKIFPMDDVNQVDIESALERFAAAGKIVRYIAGVKKAIQIVNWWKYQQPQWAGRSSLPAPQGWTDRERFHSKGNEIVSVNWTCEGGYIVAYVGRKVKNEGEGDIKGEGEVKGEGEADPGPRPSIYSVYEKEIGCLTPLIAEELDAAEQEYSAGWIEDAIKEAVKNNARNWKYTEAILKRWKTQGRGDRKNGNGSAAEKTKILTDWQGNKLEVPA